MTIFLVSVAVALGVSFVCSLVEAALLSLTPGQVAELSVRDPRLGGIVRGFKLHLERPIAVILILNTAAHTIGASVAGSQFDELFGDQWIWLFSLIFTFVMLQYTEILPKTLGVFFNQSLSLRIARPLSFGVRVLSPVVSALHLLNKPFDLRRYGHRAQPTALDEISSLAAVARLSNHIGQHQEQIINRAVALSSVLARDVMLPVGKISMLKASQGLTEAIDAGMADAHTRYPVCEDGDRDRVVGYVHLKEVIYFARSGRGEASLRDIMRPLHSSGPETAASDLLAMLVDRHEHIALVRDPAGPTLGLVTLHDLVEELLGEVHGELERLPRHVQPLGKQSWMLGSGLTMAEVGAAVGRAVPDEGTTLGVWLEQRLGTAPCLGQVASHGDLEFRVRRVRRGQIYEAAVSWLGSE